MTRQSSALWTQRVTSKLLPTWLESVERQRFLDGTHHQMTAWGKGGGGDIVVMGQSEIWAGVWDDGEQGDLGGQQLAGAHTERLTVLPERGVEF